MREIILLVCVFTLSSCASIPDTSAELIGSTQIKQTTCYSQNYESVAIKVKTFLEQCYHTQTYIIPIAGVPIPMTSEYEVIEENGNKNKRYSVRSKYGFGLSVDIKPNINTCGTQVDMYAVRNHMREKFNRIDEAINDKNPGCGII